MFVGMVYIFSLLADIYEKMSVSSGCFMIAPIYVYRSVLDKIAGKVDGKYFSVVIVVVDIRVISGI